jgi:DNA-binding LacI/PurR family transcriptional regulator
MLRTHRTQIIGVVIPDPVQHIFASDNPYYYTTLIQEISAVTQQRDYAMLLWIGNDSEQDERFYERVLRNGLMDGLLSVATRSSEAHLVQKLIASAMPFVLLGRPVGGLADQVNFVSVDNAGASMQAVQHLLDRGCQRIGHITGSMDNPDSQERLEGYRQIMQDQGLYQEAWVLEGEFNRESGYAAMKKLLAEGLDAVYCASDLIAFGAMQAVEEAGLRVPEDIALVGFDDVPLASQIKPALTTIQQPLAQKAQVATTMLLDQIEGQGGDPQQVFLSTQLIVRDSTA